MNDSGQTSASTPPRSGGCAGRQFLAILAAAVVLGLVYNIASPLGVRAPEPTSNPVATPVSSNVHTPVVTAPATNLATTSLPTSAALRWIQVKALLAAGQIVLLDARAKTAYDIEHIPGALSLPANSEPAEFVTFATQYPQSTAIVVYCGGGNCDLSHELREKLTKDLGYTNVKEMPGGIVEWRVTEGKKAPPETQ